LAIRESPRFTSFGDRSSRDVALFGYFVIAQPLVSDGVMRFDENGF